MLIKLARLAVEFQYFNPYGGSLGISKEKITLKPNSTVVTVWGFRDPNDWSLGLYTVKVLDPLGRNVIVEEKFKIVDSIR